MKSLPAIALAAALLAGCATQGTMSIPAAQNGAGLGFERDDRPAILFVKSPAFQALPQQIIGDERPDLVLDGLS